MADRPKKEVIALTRAIIELIRKSSNALIERILSLVALSGKPSDDGVLQLNHPTSAYLLFSQLHVGYKATSDLCQDLLDATPPESDNVIVEPDQFAMLLELSTSTKSWEEELLKKYGLSLNLQ